MSRGLFPALLLGLAAPALLAQPPAAQAPAPAATPDPARLAAAERLVDLIMPGDLLRRALTEDMPGAETPPDQLNSEDPHSRERMEIRTRVTREVIAETMIAVEPDLRRLFASFFARRFTSAEIGELTVFFATPAGRKYAESALMLTRDPLVVEGMRAIMPLAITLGMRIDERVHAATAHLPEPPVEEEIFNMSNAQ
jgi:hypothetical protein